MSNVIVTPAVNAHAPQEPAAPVESPQTPVAEPAAPQTEAPKQDDKFASRFAALSRKEKEIRLREQKAEQERKAWEAEKKALQEKLSPYENLDEVVKANPLKFLSEKGITYEELTKQVLNDQNPTAERMIQNLEEKLSRKYEAQLAELQKKIEEKEAQEAEQQLEQQKQAYRAEINDYVTKNDKYELIALNNAQETVFEVILQHYEQTKAEGEPRVMEISEAADAVEAYLEEQASALLEKSKKLKSKLGASTPSSNKPEGEKRQSPSTLSNAQAVQAVTTGQRNLSSEESKAEAAKLLRWIE